MDTRTISRRRLAPAVLAGALLLAPLAGCGDTADTDAAPAVTATESAPAGGTGDPTATAEPGATDATGTNADVNCTGTSCAVTLSGDGAQADILGTPIVLGAVESGRASIRVGDQEIGCSQGESVSAGPLNLECTTVTEDTVTMTASLG
ncbi:MAG TPA: hypothetical protein VEZ18_18980 [Geodermatophilus sp.]|nr:hypothetical protein [Geodermatophilus sp.]